MGASTTLVEVLAGIDRCRCFLGRLEDRFLNRNHESSLAGSVPSLLAGMSLGRPYGQDVQGNSFISAEAIPLEENLTFIPLPVVSILDTYSSGQMELCR